MIYRPEIDGLRAVAVSAVILFHYFGNFVPLGYLGVDVFFVISGYVITAYLFNAPKASLSNFLLTFYSRRVKRLLPALSACVAITAIFFVALIVRPPWEAFATGAWALVGFSNVQLLRSSKDYFALDAQLNPFTQTWSLGVEEQFYFLYPVLIALSGYSWKSHRYTESRAVSVMLILTFASIGCYALLQKVYPNAAFYLMPPRFWELGAGGLIYLTRDFQSPIRREWIANGSALGLIICFAMPDRWAATMTLLTVLLTAVLIFASQSASVVCKVLTRSPVVFVGRISYSLYLWHWSVLVLGQWTLGKSFAVLPFFLIASVLLAIASYVYIEGPLRHAKWSNSNVRTIAMGAAIALPLFGIVYQVVPRYAETFKDSLPALLGVLPPEPPVPNLCQGRESASKLDELLQFCLSTDRSPEKPNVLYLLGDSHAAQLFAMVKLATKGLPLTARFINPGDEREFVLGFVTGVCKSRVLDYVLGNAQPGDAVVIAFHRGLLNPSRDKHIPLGEAVPINDRTKNFIMAIVPYVDKMVESGIKVILVGDPPLMGAVATSSTCALQVKLFGSSICRVTKAQDLQTRSRQDRVFAELVQRHSNAVLLWDPIDEVYGKADDIDVLDGSGQYIMFDWNHLTERAAVKLAPSFRQFVCQTLLARLHCHRSVQTE